MCIGIPMQVLSATEGRAQVTGRLGPCTVDTRLVGEVAVGDWLLIFIDAAREKLDAQRAQEILSALALLDAGLAGDVQGAAADPGFELPSAMSAAQLAALAGNT